MIYSICESLTFYSKNKTVKPILSKNFRKFLVLFKTFFTMSFCKIYC